MKRRSARRCFEALVLLNAQLDDIERRLNQVSQRLNEDAPGTGQGSEGDAIPFILPGSQEGDPSVARD